MKNEVIATGFQVCRFDFNKNQITSNTMLSLHANGQSAMIDIVDGQLNFSGDLPVNEAAKVFFEHVLATIDEKWLERARTKEVKSDEI